MINPIKSVVAIFMKHDSLDYLINKPTYSLFSWGGDGPKPLPLDYCV